MTCGVGITVEVMVILRKLKDVASNSSYNSLFFCYCSKILISFVVGAHEASGSA